MYNLIIFIISISIVLFIYFYYKRDTFTYTKQKPKFKKQEKLNTELKNLSDTYTYVYTPRDIRYMTEYLNNTKKKKQQINNEQYLYLNVNRNNNVLNDIRNYQITEENIETLLPEYLTDDKQNIHDSLVQKQSKNGYSEIQKKGIIDIETLKKQIKKYIEDNKVFCDTKKQKILNTVERIYKRNSNVSNYSDTEYSILCNTWNNDSILVKLQLIKQLDECIDEFGSLYCPTGISTRIVESLYIENPENYPKPKEIINQEILNKASILRKQHPNLSVNEFKLILIDSLYSDYDTVLSKEDISKNISEWIEYI